MEVMECREIPRMEGLERMEHKKGSYRFCGNPHGGKETLEGSRESQAIDILSHSGGGQFWLPSVEVSGEAWREFHLCEPQELCHLRIPHP